MNFLSRSRKFFQNEQIKSRKNFPVNLSPDKPETGFLFFRVVEEILFFFSHYRNALSARNSEKSVETSRICLFSLRKPLSACKPGKSDKSEVTNSVFSGHSSKAEKSTFFLRKSARNCPPEKVVRSQKSVKTEKSFLVDKRTVPQRFFNTNLSLFSFPTMPAN